MDVREPQKHLDSLLIKPAGPDCNMACSYCFYLKKSRLFPGTQVHRMSETVLEETVRQVLSQDCPGVSIGWQGGEPTLMGLSFFEKAVQFEKRYGYGKTVGNGLQTNGILIDARWARFLRTYNFLVGLSLDGPEHIHDHYRAVRGGQNSWSRVVNSAKRLLDSDVEVNALTVVNDYSSQFPEDIYAFHKSLGLTYMQFIPCVEMDPFDPTRAASFSVSPERYGDFLCTLFDLWMANFRRGKPTTSIRFFDSVLYAYADLPPPECTLLPTCGVYVVVEHNGDVFSCDFFVEEPWNLGNVLTGNLKDMLNSPTQAKFGHMKWALPAPCLRCEWLKQCQGGCTKDRIRDPRDGGLNHLCQSYKMFFDHADGRLTELTQQWKWGESRGNQTVKVGRNEPCPCGSGEKYKKCCGALLN